MFGRIVIQRTCKLPDSPALDLERGRWRLHPDDGAIDGHSGLTDGPRSGLAIQSTLLGLLEMMLCLCRGPARWCRACCPI